MIDDQKKIIIFLKKMIVENYSHNSNFHDSMEVIQTTKGKRRRVFRKSKILRNAIRVKANPSYHYHVFKRYATAAAFPIRRSNANTEATYSMNFKLSDLPNYTEFTALFDQYRIKTVVLRFRPQQSSAVLMPYDASGAIGEVIIPAMWGAPDYDDDSATSTAALKEYSHAQYWPVTKGKVVVVHLRVTPLVFDGVTPGYAAGNKKSWIDCAYPDVVHYGYKTAIEVDHVAPVVSEDDVPHFYVNVEVLYYLEFKNTR